MTDEPTAVPSEPEERVEEAGPLVGTSTELAPGVGGTGDHPAPAAMIDETGNVRVAGQPPNSALGTAPAGDAADLQSGDVVDPEAREKLNAVVEPDPYPIDRPDVGTE